jgi:hypothetical protein
MANRYDRLPPIPLDPLHLARVYGCVHNLPQIHLNPLPALKDCGCFANFVAPLCRHDLTHPAYTPGELEGCYETYQALYAEGGIPVYS